MRIVFGLQIGECDRCRRRIRDTPIVGLLQGAFQRCDIFLECLNRGVLSREFSVEFGLTFVESLLTGLMRRNDTLLGTLEGCVSIDQAPLEPFTVCLAGAHVEDQGRLALGRGGCLGRPVIAGLIGEAIRLTQIFSRVRELGFETEPPCALLAERRLYFYLPAGRGGRDVLRSRGPFLDKTQDGALIPDLLFQHPCNGAGFCEFCDEIGFALGLFRRRRDCVSQATLTRVLDRFDRVTHPLLRRFAALIGVGQSSAQLLQLAIRGPFNRARPDGDSMTDQSVHSEIHRSE